MAAEKQKRKYGPSHGRGGDSDERSPHRQAL